jgi:thiol-disulfide isomerase/thioredoxin
MARWISGALIGLSLAVAPLWAAEFRKLDSALPPPLVLKDLSGGSHDLSAYRGKVVLVNFWASWCPPCRAEMPSMQRLKQIMTGRPFVILGVGSGEEASDFAKFLDVVKVDFTVLPDPDNAVTKRWKVYGLPTSFLLDAEGRVRYALTGPTEWDEKETLLLIESLFP